MTEPFELLVVDGEAVDKVITSTSPRKMTEDEVMDISLTSSLGGGGGDWRSSNVTSNLFTSPKNSTDWADMVEADLLGSVRKPHCLLAW